MTEQHRTSSQNGTDQPCRWLTTSDETSATTTTRSTAEQPLPLSLDTLFRSMAGVTTQGGSLAEAETAINIRGLQDHGRVAVSIDGARQNFARAGHGANGTFTLDPEMLRSVSVTRGPGAAAGAIGGAVVVSLLMPFSEQNVMPPSGCGEALCKSVLIFSISS